MKLTLSQIVLESAEFKHRDDYLRLDAETRPEPSAVGLAVQVQHATPKAPGAALVRVKATSSNDSLYHFAATYVVFFGMEFDEGEAPPEDLDRRLMVTGATMLFPYLREAVANLTSRGRFGPSWLAPTNFNELVPNAAPQEALASTSE